MRIAVAWGWCVLWGTGLGWCAGQTTAKIDPYVGSKTCGACHSEIWEGFYKNPHFKSLASGKETPDRTGCEGCHGPGHEHVEQFGAKGTIISFRDLPGRRVMDACLRCHSQALSRANIRTSAHTANGVTCLSCHSIHASKSGKALLAASQTQLCYQCHADVRAQFQMPFKHRVNEGFMACSDCHDPHGAFAPTWRMAAQPKMTKQAAGEEACMRCHTDKRGPFVFEHPAVRVDGCETCHFPHGSTNSRLLRRPVVFTLCLECHNGAGTFGRETAGVFRPDASHNMADPRYQNCTACHVRIHGSNADVTFLR